MGKLDAAYNKKETRGDMACRKLIYAPHSQLRLLPEFNIKDIDWDYVEKCKQGFLAGVDIPPIHVRVSNELIPGTNTFYLDVVDGQHRTLGWGEALKEGCEIIRHPVLEVDGSDTELVFFMFRSGESSAITPVARARGYNRSRKNGYTDEEIAEGVGRSKGDVINHLLLWDCGHEVHELVNDGVVAATTVIDLARTHGPDKVWGVLLQSMADKGNTEKPARVKSSSVTPSLKKRDREVLLDIVTKGRAIGEYENGHLFWIPEELYDAFAEVHEKFKEQK